MMGDRSDCWVGCVGFEFDDPVGTLECKDVVKEQELTGNVFAFMYTDRVDHDELVLFELVGEGHPLGDTSDKVVECLCRFRRVEFAIIVGGTCLIASFSFDLWMTLYCVVECFKDGL